MGSAASIDSSVELDLTKVKELAGDRWSDAMETRFNVAMEKKEGALTIKDVKFLSPQLFVECPLSVDDAKEFSEMASSEWNDELSALFESNATEGKVMLSNWYTLAPSVFETEEDRKARQEAEYVAMLARRANGSVFCNYQMYNESFPIAENSMTAAQIDDEYGFTDVMPGCRIRLSVMESAARTAYETSHDGNEAPWVREDPIGTFKDLLSDEKYYCFVIEDPAQYEKDKKATQERLALEGKLVESSGGRAEGCSCLYGNPCVDQYICKDWDNRMTVAKANGWKGF